MRRNGTSGTAEVSMGMPVNTAARSRAIKGLARDYGVLTSFLDVTGRRRGVSEQALLGMLRSLGAPLERLEDAPAVLRERKRAARERVLEPVITVWDGEIALVTVLFPSDAFSRPVQARLTLESGEVHEWTVQNSARNGVRLPKGIPWGYHRFSIEIRGRSWESTVLSAPRKAYAGGMNGTSWGVFLPLYALHSRRSWGAGDLSDLEALHAWVSSLGGQVVGTLPLLAAYLDDPFEPSPYSPASRLFWNEFYLDPERSPELAGCPSAQQLLGAVSRGDISRLRSAPMVDYRGQMALKRRVLQELSACCYRTGGQRLAALREYTALRPRAGEYARFRAVGDRLKLPWTEWPDGLRQGAIGPDDLDPRDEQYHLYAQWCAHDQIAALAERFREKGPGLYLDLPLGLHPQAFDVWRWPGLFLHDAAGGAPPDTVFTQGQSWGFPPLHPERIREDGYRYVIEFLGHTMRRAGILRVDHIMGLHRLYCIPPGLPASDGAYINYRAEEFYAILCIESHRNRCMVIGENLGTVPPQVNRAMARHGIQHMYVVQYELDSQRPAVLPAPPEDSVASLNTHDMPTFTSYLQELDIADRIELGLLTAAGGRKERRNRRQRRALLERYLLRKGLLVKPFQEADVLRACIDHLGSSRSRVVLVNLEDLWQEILPQNVPTAHNERPNWQRKARYCLEDLAQMPAVLEPLKRLDALRKAKHNRKTGGKAGSGSSGRKRAMPGKKGGTSGR